MQSEHETKSFCDDYIYFCQDSLRIEVCSIHVVGLLESHPAGNSEILDRTHKAKINRFSQEFLHVMYTG